MVKATGPLPVAHACNFVYQAALGLQHAHGMVDRDIKPANLILSHEGKKAVIKVLDFGLAKVTSEGQVDSGLTREGQMLGTPDFIAPEQIRDAQSADIRADIYSLGCTLYYLLTGRPPFAADNLWDLYQAHFSMVAGPLNLVRPEVPGELAALVAKMMAKDPARRFQTPGEVGEALAPFFKKGNVASVGSKPDISQVGRPEARPTTPSAVPMPTRPPTELAPASTPAATKPSDAARPGSILEGLIDLGETDPAFDTMLDTPRPAVTPKLIQRGQSAWTTAVEKLSGLGPRAWWAAAGVLLLGLVVACTVVILKIKTKHGVIVVENVPESAIMEVDGDRLTVTPIGGMPIKVEGEAGKHVVVVKRGDDVLLGESVTLQSGQELKLTVHLDRPVAPRTAEADADERPSRSEDPRSRTWTREEDGTTSPTSKTSPASSNDRAVAWHRLMPRQGSKSEGPAPFACWTFESDARDEIGSLHGRLFGGASMREGRLYLDGKTGHMRTEPLAQDIREKTLEAWVLLRNLDQRGGGVISIDHGLTFNAIVFGEIEPAKWIAGSEWTHRANGLVGSVESAKPPELIHMAIA
jgi:hypothetical protein